MRLYRPIIGSRQKNLGSSDSCYHAYLVPWVPLFGLFSLWRPATPVKMNGYMRKINWILVWIFFIDWYLIWPHWTFLSWDVVHWHELGGVHIRGGSTFFRFPSKSTSEKTFPPKKEDLFTSSLGFWTWKKIFSNFFFNFLGKSTLEKTITPKKIGVRRCLGELGVSEGPKTKWGLFNFFNFLGLGVGSLRVRICRVVFVGEFEPSAAVGFRSRVFSG